MALFGAQDVLGAFLGRHDVQVFVCARARTLTCTRPSAGGGTCVHVHAHSGPRLGCRVQQFVMGPGCQAREFEFPSIGRESLEDLSREMRHAQVRVWEKSVTPGSGEVSGPELKV